MSFISMDDGIIRLLLKPSISLAAVLLLAAESAPPMPTLNIQLRFVCLSVADDRLGAIDARPLADLPDAPQDSSLAVTTSWHSGTRIATSDIRDSLGNNLHIEESIERTSTCDNLAQDVFHLERVGSDYEARICITDPRPNTLPSVKVMMQLRGQSVEALRDRILAISSCLPQRGVSVVTEGVYVGREIIRTLAD